MASYLIGEKKFSLFTIFNTMFMIGIIFVMLYPFWYSLIGSLNEGADYMRGGIYFLPRAFTIDNFRVVFNTNDIINGYKITIFRTLLGTISHVFFTALFSYGFSRKKLKGRKTYAIIGLITMYFNGGLIPTYLLYMWLGLIDNFFVYILPMMFSFFHVIIMSSFFRTIPDSINESAKIDGASEYKIFITLILPLSKPILAAIALFIGVHHWNSYFDSMVFTSSPDLRTIMYYLMKVIRDRQTAAAMNQAAAALIEEINKTVNAVTVQHATMIVATLPIIMIYPFLQKYFVKGIMIGSIKG